MYALLFAKIAFYLSNLILSGYVLSKIKYRIL